MREDVRTIRCRCGERSQSSKMSARIPLRGPPDPSLPMVSYTRLPSKKEKAAPIARPRMRKKVMREPAVSQSFPRTILVSTVLVRTCQMLLDLLLL